MAYHKKTRTPYRTLHLKGRYQDFDEIYETNKEMIYKKIIEIYEGFADSDKKVLSLYLKGLIKGLEWDTEFVFYREQTIVLIRDVMPYFEQKEDYETCIEIRNLYERLTNKKLLVTID
jgi:hypothetical protein